jgi:hypothetical protein
MSIVIVIAPTAATATAAWATLRQADLADAAPSRREQLTPQQVQQLMLKTVQQRRGATLAPDSTAAHAPTNTNTNTHSHTLDKIWTELAADLVLANVDAPRFGWHQTLDAHTPGFWQRFDPHTRFVLVYENPAQFVANNLIQHAPAIGNANTPDDDKTPGDESQTLLKTWHASHSTLLDTFYALGSDAVLVHADQMGSATALLGLPEPTAPSAMPTQQIVSGAALLTRLVQPLVKQDKQAHALWQELQAAAQAPMAEPTPDAITALHNVDAFLQLQSGLLAAHQALDAAGQQALNVQDQLASANQALQAEAAAKAAMAQQRDELSKAHAQLQAKLDAECQALQAEAKAKTETIAQRDALTKDNAELQSKLQAKTQAHQAEAAAKATAQEQLAASQNDSTRLAEQHRQQLNESQQEGELMLAQLHQVQEELEKYFIQHGEEQKARQQEAQAKAKAIHQRDEEAKAKTDLQTKLDAEAQAKTDLQTMLNAEAKAKTDLQTKLDAEAKAKADLQTKLNAEAKAQADLQTKLDAEAKAKADLQTKLNVEAQAKTDLQAKLDAEAKAKADLQAKLDGESKARQTEAQARAALQKQIDLLKHETARLAEQHRLQTQEMHEEGELLLAQLHQVQEELERYFQQYQDQKKQLQGITQFWLRHPPAELWVDMRRTSEGQGWYEAEADGRWSGPTTESRIELPPLAAGTYLVELHIADAMSPELVAGTQLQAQLSDGQTLTVELVHEFGPAPGLYPMVSAGFLQLPDGLQGSWQLNLELPEVISPANLGGDDNRQLGLRLQGLRLSQQPADSPEATT